MVVDVWLETCKWSDGSVESRKRNYHPFDRLTFPSVKAGTSSTAGQSTTSTSFSTTIPQHFLLHPLPILHLDAVAHTHSSTTMSKNKSKGSLLRLLSPLRGVGTTSKPIEKPVLKLHVADYGSILIQTTDESIHEAVLENERNERPNVGRASSSTWSGQDIHTPDSPYSTAGPSNAAGGSGSRVNLVGGRQGQNGGVDGQIEPPPPGQRPDLELSGTLEITMPPQSGKRRVQAIRVGLSARTKLNFGGKRGWEQDEIFHRKIDIKGEEKGLVLEPGTQM